MKNNDKYKKAFIESLTIDKKKFSDKLEYNQIPEWDSIGHMTLISTLEDIFNITIDTDDIIDFSSFIKGKKIIKKYGVDFNI